MAYTQNKCLEATEDQSKDNEMLEKMRCGWEITEGLALLRKVWEVFSNEKMLSFKATRKVEMDLVKEGEGRHWEAAQDGDQTLEEWGMLRHASCCSWLACRTLCANTRSANLDMTQLSSKGREWQYGTRSLLKSTAILAPLISSCGGRNDEPKSGDSLRTFKWRINGFPWEQTSRILEDRSRIIFPIWLGPHLRILEETILNTIKEY